MSQTFFSKLDATEKTNRLAQLGSSQSSVTVWIKGKKEKHVLLAESFNQERKELALDSQDSLYPDGTEVLCSFELRGMTFFSQVIFRKSSGDISILQFRNDLFKSERRSSFRLLTYPLYEVWADIDLGERYEGSNVIDMNARTSQTKLFQNFIKLAGGEEEGSDDLSKIKVRVQDISTTGMSIHIGELETRFFTKDKVFMKVIIHFSDEVVEIPEMKIVYVVDYVSNDQNIKRYKIGCHFLNLPLNVDDILGKKINKLLRENDFNKDFENFIK